MTGLDESRFLLASNVEPGQPADKRRNLQLIKFPKNTHGMEQCASLQLLFGGKKVYPEIVVYLQVSHCKSVLIEV